MKHTKGTRAAVVAATLLAAGLATAGTAQAAPAHVTRISAGQLHASIAQAVSQESVVCSAGVSIHPMGGRFPTDPTVPSQA